MTPPTNIQQQERSIINSLQLLSLPKCVLFAIYLEHSTDPLTLPHYTHTGILHFLIHTLQGSISLTNQDPPFSHLTSTRDPSFKHTTHSSQPPPKTNKNHLTADHTRPLPCHLPLPSPPPPAPPISTDLCSGGAACEAGTLAAWLL